MLFSAESRDPVFRRLPAESFEHMQRQRAFVRELVAKHFPSEKIVRGPSDFVLLQKILDAKLVGKNETWKLQSLGVVFGDALVTKIAGLSWWEVTDEYGTDPTLRFRDKMLQVNVLTMLSKRVEDGREIDVAHMAKRLEEYVHDEADKVK